MSTINLLTRDNAAGLSRDLDLLDDVLRGLGHATQITHLRRRARMQLLGLQARELWRGWRAGGTTKRFDLNLMLERVRPELCVFARRNILIPNPEWFAPEQRAALASFDGVFAKTRHAQALFAALGCTTTYIGFTSVDRLQPDVPRERKFLHIAGRSSNKGTQVLLETWARHPDWPPLTAIWRVREPGALPQAANIRYRRDYVDDAELRVLQNAHLFHLCPSETEGYGHYLVEALGLGAIVFTLDAPPMSELVDESRGLLIRATPKGQQGLATTYTYAADDLAASIEFALSLPPEQLDIIGNAARTWFVANAATFPGRLRSALATLD